MAEFTFDFVFLSTFREDYLALDRAAREMVGTVISRVREDPWIDRSRHKYQFPTTVFDLIVYDDHTWSVVYRIVDASVVELWAVERSDPN